MANSSAEAAARWLLTPEAIREQCGLILAAAERDELEHFSLNLTNMAVAADLVTETTRAAYPELKIPFHARWRHFVLDGVDRWQPVAAQFVDPLERARVAIELAITSVLLDAGAGAAWRYRDAQTGKAIARSEGLAIASFDVFMAGAFSSDPDNPLRADADALSQFSSARLTQGFQVTAENPLEGLDGRARLLSMLGKAVADGPEWFGRSNPRLGHLADYFLSWARDGTLPAREILITILRALGPIWPSRIELSGLSLGDTWRHPAAHRQDAAGGLVPFHKLSQWLSYSLVEPLEELGLRITDPDALTGLAEYRNGGLFIDTAVLSPRSPALLSESWPASSEPIVEWRALTVALLDKLAPMVRDRLGVTETQMPLAAVLEGGTWATGRKLAGQKREGAAPPITIESDGSVF